MVLPNGGAIRHFVSENPDERFGPRTGDMIWHKEGIAIDKASFRPGINCRDRSKKNPSSSTDLFDRCCVPIGEGKAAVLKRVLR